MGTLSVTLYFKDDCHSCDSIQKKYDKLRRHYNPFEVVFKKVNIGKFAEDYGFKSLPAVTLFERKDDDPDGEEVAKIDEDLSIKKIETKIKENGKSASIWRIAFFEYWWAFLVPVIIFLFLKYKK